MLENIPGILSLITALIGLLNYNKLPNYKSKLFLASIIISVITEVVAIYFRKWTNLSNYFIYDLYTLLLFLIYYFILANLMIKYINKILSISLICIYFTANIFFIIKDFNKIGVEINTYVYTLSVLFFFILSTTYLIELFNSSNVINYKKSIFFWFVLGALLFHIPFTPFMLTLRWWSLESYGKTVYWIIIIMLNLVMNTCFIIGFLWTEKKYNY